jgi:cyclophilin family peptidyl-prolyl cis-trans isomerase
MTANTAKTITLLTVSFGVSLGCQPQPEPAAKGEPAVAKTTNKPTRTAGDPAAPKAGAPDKPVPNPAANCSFYCLDGTPCGDKCIEDGKTCEEATTTACAGTERPTPQFRKGDRALGGLIKSDVPVFNKAQGDPIDGEFTLAMAFEGDETLADKSKGKLKATIETDLGNIECELYEDVAPLTVANFVGLSRGTRPFYDRKTKAWEKRVYFDNVLFHRVIAGFMIQTGDHTGSGTGGPGYFVADEFDPKVKHSKKGMLSMANRNKPDRRTGKLPVDPKTGQHLGNTGSSQFFVTVRKTPHLDMRHTVFGECDPAIPLEISKVPTRADRPLDPVRMKRVTIKRG